MVWVVSVPIGYNGGLYLVFVHVAKVTTSKGKSVTIRYLFWAWVGCLGLGLGLQVTPVTPLFKLFPLCNFIFTTQYIL